MTDQQLTPARLAQMQDCFEKALELAPEARDRYLRSVTEADPTLGSQVRALLEAHDRTGPELDSPLVGAAIRALEPAVDPRVGIRVGVYQVVRRIGEGGMGTVYEATRADDQYQMRVAIKFLRPLAAGDATLRRFRAERQILANLQHRNIAALLDGGVTPGGEPYFVMEYIEGEPITRWCDARLLPVRERLALFRQVCAAVQYAHQSLVIHRDLKPGNILVTEDGTVKLLDFGIAKLMPEDDTGTTDLPATEVGARAYTPEYAAPEQISGRPIGTRADVYALGVLLYELLAGSRPFDLQGKSAVEVERIVGEVAPARPSDAIRDDRAGFLSERSDERVRDRLVGDLDAIVLKALRKEPERRYGSAEELAADVRDHLAGRPVTARPDGLAYRFGKLIRRRRAEAVAILLAVVSLVGGLVATYFKALEAERERVRATEVKTFLTTMLNAANPASFGRDVQVRTVLDSASVRADGLGDRPQLEAEIREIIGGTYLALGEFSQAEAEYRRALTALERLVPEGNRATALALSRVSTALEFEGRYVEADSVLQVATRLLERFTDPDDPGRGDHLDARARILTRLGRITEAVPLLREALEIQKRATPVNDSVVAYSYANLGMVMSELSDHAAAESLMVAGLTAARRAFGEVHPLVASILSPLASVQAWAGKTAQADSTYRATIEMRRQLLGPEHPDYAWSMFNYADFLVREQRYPEAVIWAHRVLELRGRTLTDDHPAVGTAMGIVGRALGRMDSLDAAEKWLRESWQVRKNTLPAGHFLIASSEGYLGELFVLAGRYREAEPHLLASERQLVEARGESAPIVADSRQRLVDLYAAWGRPEAADHWRGKLAASRRPPNEP